ncbi:MAG: cysteine synthase A [Alphaproteobacteria bacterium]
MQTATGFIGAIGGTPLILLEWASRRTGCRIYGKAEFLNPGGSVKDRAAHFIIDDAERRGLLRPGGTVVEGTAGNTGIGLALVGNARGYRTVIVMPETQSQEKKDMLRLCGADLRLVPAVPYKDPNNYVRYSERLAGDLGAFWANQFDNTANRTGHQRTTGPEIWTALEGRIDAFTCAVGTGGTIAGVAMALKERDPKVRIVLADPMGSALYSYYTSGTLTAEGTSITEGIGQGRITRNLADAPIDEAVRVTDPECLDVLFNLVKHEGLVLGGSSGINVAAAMKVATTLGPGHTVVTVLCDGGSRYQSKLYNPEFLRARSLPAPDWMV